MKRFISLLLVLVMVFSLAGCGSTREKTTDENQAQVTQELLKEANAQVGMPEIHNFFEKDMMKYLYELRDDSELITYTYIVNLDGRLVYQGQSIGFGIPASVQFSNPEKFIDNNYDLGEGWGGIILPQAEPNGLFMPEGLSATWIIMVNEETGELMPEYFEPTIVVKQQKAPRRLCAEWSLPDNY